MSSAKFSINGNIIIYRDKIAYKCTIQDLREDYMLINIPIGEGGRFLDISLGDEIEMNYYYSDCYYIFKTKAIDKKLENNILLYKLELPYDVQKVQRRNFVRVDLVEYAFYRKESMPSGQWKRAMILNLSGGGMKMSVQEYFDKDEKLLINIYTEDEKLQVEGSIVREIEKTTREQVCAVKFINISERTRDKIIQKVFNQMRKQRDYI